MLHSEDSSIQEQNEYICNQCTEKCGKSSSKHILVSSAEYDLRCKICNKFFNTSFVTKKEKKLHKCKICKEVFENFSQLKRHSYTHNNQWPYRCSVCEKGFAFSSDLRRHMSAHNENRAFQCIKCDLKYKYKCGLINHSQHHSGIFKWNCGICSIGFAYESELKVHMLYHKEEKGFVCNDCGLAFKSKGTLTRHSQIKHSEKYKYKCDMCSRGFISKSSLENHEHRCHSSNQILKGNLQNKCKCKLCLTKFANERDFEIHPCFPLKETYYEKIELPSTSDQRTISDDHHSEETTSVPFRCDVCGFIYATSLELKRHKQLSLRIERGILKKNENRKEQGTISDGHHSEENMQYPIQCDLGSSVTISDFELGMHKKIFHGIERGPV
ncbi:hypothetical protein TNCT_4481 [Trichonephila clavata]|uniref:C2H2-type domain-containing protein n=1 Tax=Trichonephila clavata TaxID=2740835 RepID=A0A8X6EYR2_TRICU|nr:hypothetical protein TNCT_4481 [Trichonephila clavata]